MEYYRLTHSAGLLSAVFMTKDVTQARGPLQINNFHPLSDINMEKKILLCKKKVHHLRLCASACVCMRVCMCACVCCYQKYVNDSALLSRAPNGINEENQR